MIETSNLPSDIAKRDVKEIVQLTSDNNNNNNNHSNVTSAINPEESRYESIHEHQNKMSVDMNHRIDKDTNQSCYTSKINQEESRCEGISEILLKAMLVDMNHRIDKSIDIIIDSGATNHMFPVNEFMYNYINLNTNSYVSLGNPDMKIKIRGEGEVNLVGRALFVPQLKFGLISISKLAKDRYITVVADQKLSIVDVNSNTLLTATEKDGLYYLDDYYLRKILLRRKQSRVFFLKSYFLVTAGS